MGLVGLQSKAKQSAILISQKRKSGKRRCELSFSWQTTFLWKLVLTAAHRLNLMSGVGPEGLRAQSGCWSRWHEDLVRSDLLREDPSWSTPGSSKRVEACFRYNFFLLPRLYSFYFKIPNPTLVAVMGSTMLMDPYPADSRGDSSVDTSATILRPRFEPQAHHL